MKLVTNMCRIVLGIMFAISVFTILSYAHLKKYEYLQVVYLYAIVLYEWPWHTLLWEYHSD